MSAELICNVIRVFKSREGHYNTKVMRVVEYVVGKKMPFRKLENREFFFTKSGEMRAGKARSLDYDDIKFIIENGAEILESLELKLVSRQNPPLVKP